ncbi:MAG TPA: hypothetical protein PLB32_19375, partial [Acidobacteriota bacterium]|nr:hypothetical protein [Acidobacteriota bacterium]
MSPRRHPDGWPVWGDWLKLRLTRPPGEIQGNDREESIGTGGCRLSSPLYGDVLKGTGGSSGAR